MNEKVSIIIPVYQAEQFIINTIKSVQRQTYTNWELLLIVDGSPDHSAEVIDAYLKETGDERITLYVRTNEGAAKTRNFGVSKASGRYVGYLDADDIWKENKLEKQLTFMQDNNAGFCFTSYEFGDALGNGTGKIVKVPATITYKQALQNTTIFTSTVLFDTNQICKEEIQMPDMKSEDSALWFRILREGRIAYGLNENLVIYRRTGATLSSNKFEAMRRIWCLYRKSEHLSIMKSAYNFIFWAFRAVSRRI